MTDDQLEYHFYHMTANWIDIINFLSSAIVMYLPHNIMRVTHQHIHQVETDTDNDTFFEFACDWSPERMAFFLDNHNMRNIANSIVYDGQDQWNHS